MNNPDKPVSRLSYTHERPDLFGGSPLYGKTPMLTQSFGKQRCPLHAKQLKDLSKNEAERRRELETFKAKRRGSEMIKKDRPKPVAKPSPQMAFGPDSATFNAAWASERRSARRAARLEEAQGDHESLTEKQAFKIKRRAEAKTRQALSQSKAFRRSAG